jgi:hypothetical protein
LIDGCNGIPRGDKPAHNPGGVTHASYCYCSLADAIKFFYSGNRLHPNKTYRSFWRGEAL